MGKVYGIDLGTTYSCIATINDYGKPEVINNQDSSPVTPSVVAFEESGNVSVGEAAKSQLESDPQNVCSTIKREIGKRDYNFIAFGKEYSPETISSLILKKIVKDAQEVSGSEVKDVVITCPAYFGMDQRDATKKAGILAGLNVLEVLNEPTAAAISYGIDVNTPQTVMVYDLGGGTFDVTIINVSSGEIRVVATGGDHQLGGKNWDEKIIKYAVDKFCAATGSSEDDIYSNLEMMGELELKAEAVKQQLTQKDKAIIKVNSEKIEITRDIFDDITKDLLTATIDMTRSTMKDAEEKGTQKYDKILLVGGSTRMKQVMERLKKEFPSTPIEFCDPDQSVAKGAAIEAARIVANLANEKGDKGAIPPGFQNKKLRIINVLSQSIAEEFYDPDKREHYIVNIIKKNTELPHDCVSTCYTVEDGQTGVRIRILENASSDYNVDESICSDVVQDVLKFPKPMPKGTPVETTFHFTEEGLLTITSTHKESGASLTMEAKLVNSLTEKQMEEEQEKIAGLTIM